MPANVIVGYIIIGLSFLAVCAVLSKIPSRIIFPILGVGIVGGMYLGPIARFFGFN